MKEMRRSDRKTSYEEAIEFLKSAEHGVLSTVTKEGIPYGVPVNFVYEDNNIYIHSAQVGQKLDNIEYNNNGCFTVIASTELLKDKFSTKYESAIVIGTLNIVEDSSEKEKALLAIIKKYSDEFIESGIKYIKSAIAKTTVIRLDIKEVTGKARR